MEVDPPDAGDAEEKPEEGFLDPRAKGEPAEEEKPGEGDGEEEGEFDGEEEGGEEGGGEGGGG